MTGWKIPIFNRKYIDSNGGCFIVILVFWGVLFLVCVCVRVCFPMYFCFRKECIGSPKDCEKANKVKGDI